jgi:hypothetical protein
VREATLTEMEDMQDSEAYAEFIVNNCGGERVICNGDTLLQAQEDGYLFEEFAASLGLVLP